MKLYNTVDKEVLKKQIQEDDEPRITLSFYQYYHIGNPVVFRHYIYYHWTEVGVLGRIYVAKEGVNAQLSVPKKQFEAFKSKLGDITFLENVRLNIAIEDDGKSFYKLKIKVKEKIVADGLNDDAFDVTDKGTHLNAESFNEIVNQPETIIVDMRNHYESEVGHFENAICPDVDTFRDSLPIVVDMLKEKKDQPIVMYCTGGIRCEKASAYLKHNGFNDVYQLEGGIIEYTRQVRNLDIPNKFKGKNFVFDERLGERINHEVISHCHQCEQPSDRHSNCENRACHLLLIQCEACSEKFGNCCSQVCYEYTQLPEENQIELRKGVYINAHAYKKGRNSPFLENKELVEKVRGLYATLNPPS